MVADQLDAINKGAATLGVRIVDIRIKRIDLPPGGEVIEQVYRRMRAQRQQVASALRAEGEELSQTIRAAADRQQQVILATADRHAQKLRAACTAARPRNSGQADPQDPDRHTPPP